MAQKKEESKGGFSTVADRVLGYEEDVRAQLDWLLLFSVWLFLEGL
jgi:hypothetical protein